MKKLSKTRRNALVLMARVRGACPGFDAGLSMRMADKLVAEGLANFSQRAGVMSYRITDKGREVLRLG